MKNNNSLFWKYICLILYYGFAKHLPVSYSRIGGGIFKKIRGFLCSQIFEYAGKNINVERGAHFGKGFKLRLGDNSGLGVNCVVPNDATIGNNVMMGPNCYVHQRNHTFARIDIPMCQQGFSETKSVIIDDDVWIGRNVTIMIGRHISKGSIIAANCVLTKDFPEYSIVGGNPSKLIRSRLEDAK